MDKVSRLQRKGGKLRGRIWSHFLFIFYDGKAGEELAKNTLSKLKVEYPFLFIRSYIYLIFIDRSEFSKNTLIKNEAPTPEKKDYKIWYYNTNYELKPFTIQLAFGATLKDTETPDDIMHLVNPNEELKRVEVANSEIVDFVRAFSGDLSLFTQTSQMFKEVCKELDVDEPNSSTRILVEGPARSGKTIIASSLLGKYKNSKFLLMNRYFHRDLIDGLHGLLKLKKEEISKLVGNPVLDSLIFVKEGGVGKIFEMIIRNLDYAIDKRLCEPQNTPKTANAEDIRKSIKQTKEYLINNINKANEIFEPLKSNIEYDNIPDDMLEIIESLLILRNELKENKNNYNPFIDIGEKNLIVWKNLLSGFLEDLKNADIMQKFQNAIIEAISELIKNSGQKFFHHDIRSEFARGCWIKRGNPTLSKMWTDDEKVDLIICDEVQRLGFIGKFRNCDAFNEIKQILSHSEKSFFVGDNFQMLNYKYDQGIKKIQQCLKEQDDGLNGELSRKELPDSVGIPPEIGKLMKYLTNPDEKEIEDVVDCFKKRENKNYKIVFIYNDNSRLVKEFDEDKSVRKHFAIPLDSLWLKGGDEFTITGNDRKISVIPEDITKKYPFFCNEEIMPNYYLSAYQLISREIDSLYVNIPIFSENNPMNDENPPPGVASDTKVKEWYRKHLYVLFTRPTEKLVVNFENPNDYSLMINRVYELIKKGISDSTVEFDSNDH